MVDLTACLMYWHLEKSTSSRSVLSWCILKCSRGMFYILHDSLTSDTDLISITFKTKFTILLKFAVTLSLCLSLSLSLALPPLSLSLSLSLSLQKNPCMCCLVVHDFSQSLRAWGYELLLKGVLDKFTITPKIFTQKLIFLYY